MKKRYCFLSVFIFFFCSSFVNAQGLMEISGLSAISVHPAGKTIRARGFDVGFYTPPINLIKVNPAFAKEMNPQSPLNLRFGLDFMPAWMGREKFSDVPLNAPETGYAKVTISDHFFAMNGTVRLAMSCCNNHVHPYIDLSAGFRKVASKIDIASSTPTDSALATIKGGTMGIAIGTSMAITPNQTVLLNTSIGWNHCNVNGGFIDMNSIHRRSAFIGYGLRPAINNFVMINIGLSIALVYNDKTARNYSSKHKNSGTHSGHSNGHSHVSTGHCSGHGK